jgi:hypothetical protein
MRLDVFSNDFDVSPELRRTPKRACGPPPIKSAHDGSASDSSDCTTTTTTIRRASRVRSTCGCGVSASSRYGMRTRTRLSQWTVRQRDCDKRSRGGSPRRRLWARPCRRRRTVGTTRTGDSSPQVKRRSYPRSIVRDGDIDMLILNTHRTAPGTRRPDKHHLRATPTTAFLDFDPILPGWPTPDAGPRADGGTGIRQRRRRRRARRRSNQM